MSRKKWSAREKYLALAAFLGIAALFSSFAIVLDMGVPFETPYYFGAIVYGMLIVDILLDEFNFWI